VGEDIGEENQTSRPPARVGGAAGAVAAILAETLTDVLHLLVAIHRHRQGGTGAIGIVTGTGTLRGEVTGGPRGRGALDAEARAIDLFRSIS